MENATQQPLKRNWTGPTNKGRQFLSAWMAWAINGLVCYWLETLPWGYKISFMLILTEHGISIALKN